MVKTTQLKALFRSHLRSKTDSCLLSTALPLQMTSHSSGGFSRVVTPNIFCRQSSNGEFVGSATRECNEQREMYLTFPPCLIASVVSLHIHRQKPNYLEQPGKGKPNPIRWIETRRKSIGSSINLQFGTNLSDPVTM